ncbi:MAG: lipocalin family protein [Muribaculaceae bacterium]|nr:lipocalin family protein [Muribaculaceae bacterium]
MKKILLLMALILPFLLTSCGDDKEKDEPQTLEQQLIGDWKKVDGTNNENEAHYIFNSNHTGRYKYLTNGTTVRDYDYTWSLEGNLLTMTNNYNGNTSTQKCEITIENDILIMTTHGPGNSVILNEYHRVKG